MSFEKELQKHIQQVKLTGSEKRHIRTILTEKMFTAKDPTPSPFMWMVFLGRHAVAFAMAFLFVSAGITFAAETSLPGDVLYGIKRSVNEEVRSFLTTSPVSKAQYQTTLIDKRIAEAKKLREEGKLTPEASERLKQSIEEHGNDVEIALTRASKEEVESISEHGLEVLRVQLKGAILAQLGKIEELESLGDIESIEEVSVMALTEETVIEDQATTTEETNEVSSTTTNLSKESAPHASVRSTMLGKAAKSELTETERALRQLQQIMDTEVRNDPALREALKDAQDRLSSLSQEAEEDSWEATIRISEEIQTQLSDFIDGDSSILRRIKNMRQEKRKQIDQAASVQESNVLLEPVQQESLEEE